MTCPLENRMCALLESSGIIFTRPERDQRDPTTLDFYLPTLNTYIEVKQFHTARIAKQLEPVPKGATAIVLQGINAVRDFEQLCKIIRKNWENPTSSLPPAR